MNFPILLPLACNQIPGAKAWGKGKEQLGNNIHGAGGKRDWSSGPRICHTVWRKKKEVVLKEMGNCEGLVHKDRVIKEKAWGLVHIHGGLQAAAYVGRSQGKYPRLFTEAEMWTSLWKVFPKHPKRKRDDSFQRISKTEVRLLYSALWLCLVLLDLMSWQCYVYVYIYIYTHLFNLRKFANWKKKGGNKAF